MTKLFCGGIPFKASEDDVRDWFEQNGVTVGEKISIPVDRETQRSRGFAFIEVDQENLNLALDLNGENMNGRQVTINEARPKGGGDGGYRGR